MGLKFSDLERMLANPVIVKEGRPAYCECGRYKPFSEPVIAAAKRRGYRVERLARGVYNVYPKAA